MRIGIKTNPQNTTFDDMLAVWRHADQIEEVESAWVFDHFYPIFSNSTGPCMEGWTVLAALAQATSRIQLGTMVNGMPYRHPAVTANMAASLDIISDGRFQLGLGAGWNQEEAGAYGISLGTTVGERMDMFDEAVEVIVGLLTQEETTFHGDHYRLTKARNEPKGPQQPHPPIVIGGGGEKRTLRTVARWAQHWNSLPLETDEWKRKRAVLDTHCEAVERDPNEIMNSMLFRFDPADPTGFTEWLKRVADAGVTKAVINVPTPHRTKHVDQIVELVTSIN
jgi:F420-dependent oxidoreductase-like protein